MNEHQLLVVGYQDTGNGKAVLTLWDNAYGPQVIPMNIDTTGSELNVAGYYSDVKGIARDQYAAVTPPASLMPWPDGATIIWSPEDTTGGYEP